MKVSKKVAVAIGAIGVLGSMKGALADFDKSEWSCVTEARATDFIRQWDEDLGETKLSNIADRCEDEPDFEPFEDNARQYQSDMWNQAADFLTEVFMPTLNVQGTNGGADVYYCDKGIKWYTVNAFKGCTLKDGKTYSYGGKKYKASGNKGVMEVGMTISYVCNEQARVRDVAVSYTTATKTACRP